MSRPYYSTIKETLEALGVESRCYKATEAKADKWNDFLTGNYTPEQMKMLSRVPLAKNLLGATAIRYTACTTDAARDACLDTTAGLIERLVQYYIDAEIDGPTPLDKPFPFPCGPDKTYIHTTLIPACREVHLRSGGSTNQAELLDDISKNARMRFYGPMQNRKEEYIAYSKMTLDESHAAYVSGMKHGTLDWYSRQIAMTLLLDPVDQARYLAMIVKANTNDKTKLHNLFVGWQYDKKEPNWTIRHGQQLEDLTEMLLFVNRPGSSEAEAYNAKLLQSATVQGAGPGTQSPSPFLMQGPPDRTQGRASDIFGGEIPMPVVSRDGSAYIDGQPIKDYIDALIQRLYAEWARERAHESSRPRHTPRHQDFRSNDFDGGNRSNSQRRSQSQGRPPNQGRASDKHRPRGAGEGNEPTTDSARNF